MRARSSSFLSETLAIAYATGLIYMMAGAFEFGREDQFNFTYISLGLEDIVYAIRQLVVPLAYTAGLTLALSFLAMFLFKTSERNSLVNAIYLIAPLCLLPILCWRYGTFTILSRELVWLVLSYYLLDIFLWRLAYRLIRPTPFHIPVDQPFRIVQLGIGSLVLIVLAYNVGAHEAQNLTDIELCPQIGDVQSIVVERADDIVICARFDMVKRIAYTDFIYFKIPDDGRPHQFHKVKVSPAEIGNYYDP